MQYVIVADDFTGAGDTGVQFLRSGMDASIVWNADVRFSPNEAIVLDTETRNLPPQEAARRVRSSVKPLLRDGRAKCFYKKIDSTLRGNVHEEVQALAEVLQPSLIVLAPAYPEMGRTTRAGKMYVQGVPLLQTEYANDPICPAQTASLFDLAHGWLPHCVLHTCAATRDEEEALEAGAVHLFDGNGPEDLQRAVRAGLRHRGRVLWVGSAGLANALLEAAGTRESCAPQPLFNTSDATSDAPALAVVGSISRQAFSQIHYAEAKGAFVRKIASEKEQASEGIETVFAQALRAAHQGRHVLLTGARSRADYEESVRVGAAHGIAPVAVSQNIREALARHAFAFLQRARVSGLFLTGGDTAIAVLRALRCAKSHILRETEPGVVLSELVGGARSGLPVLTKAGGFGTERTLWNALQLLRKGEQA